MEEMGSVEVVSGFVVVDVVVDEVVKRMRRRRVLMMR